MKVPVTTRTISTGGGARQFVQGSNQNIGGQIAQSLGNLGSAVSQAALQVKQRDDQLTKFNTLRDFSEFETSVAADVTALKRDAPADGKGFTQSADALYSKMETMFLNEKVPPELRDEFSMRAGEIKQRVLGDALKFQYEAGDAWFKQGISDQLSKSKVVLDQNPADLEGQQRAVWEMIDTSDLSEIDKVNLKKETAIALASTVAYVETKNNPEVRGELGVGEPTSIVDKIIGVESGGKANAQNPNSSAGGVGQFIDSTWLAIVRKYKPELAGASDSEILGLKNDPKLGREMTTRLTEENMQKLTRAGITPTAGATYLAHFLGPGDAIKVMQAAPDTPISEIVGEGSIKANGSILAGKTAGDVRGWASKKMGAATLATDPRFDIIPYEDRIAIRDDAVRAAQAEATAAKAQAKAAQDQAQNNLYLGLLDGTAGQVDIDNARKNGTLSDYDSVAKATGILTKRDAEGNLAANAVLKLNTPGATFDPGDTTDKKMLNAIVGKNGLEKIRSGDEGYVHEGIVPLVNQTGDIPTDVAGTFTGMLRGSNNSQAMFALDAMAQLQDTSEAAFNQRFDSATSQAVDLWQLRKDITPKEELLGMIRGGTTQAERQAKTMLRKEAQDILGRNEDGVPVIRNMLGQVLEGFNGWTYSANNYTSPVAQQALAKEFQTQFVDAYSKTGDTDAATEMARKELSRTWDVTDIGSGKLLMKYPPEKSGYRPYAGGFDWINEQARADLKLAPEENFQLFSDEQTRQEVNNFKKSPDAQPPSYRIFTIDANGVAKERVDEKGVPQRLFFKAPNDVVKLDNDIYDWRADRARLEEEVHNYQLLREGAFTRGEEIPQEDTNAFFEAEKQLQDLNNKDPRPKTRIYDTPTFGRGKPNAVR